MQDYSLLRRAWAGELDSGQREIPDWPSAGVAIEGDFSGIQRFVLRPVPGAGGAARRLRARSFRVLAITRLIAVRVEERFSDAGARLFYSAGGRFLIVANPCPDWRERLTVLQRELDSDLVAEYRGELAFHLAGASFGNGRIPRTALGAGMAQRKLAPLQGALQDAGGCWASGRFVFTFQNASRCKGCDGTAVIKDRTEELCHTCVQDRELGARLLASSRHLLTRQPQGPLRLLDQSWGISGESSGTGVQISTIGHVPLKNGRMATFEELASRAKGRPYLAYLRIDADRIGEAFGKLEGSPQRVWGLSRLLDSSFSATVETLLKRQFPSIYPVYGGGDDLFVIGPWQDVLHFAAGLRKEFRELSADKLTFSAGVALAKKKQHILTKAEEAEKALNVHAKNKRDSIHALGCTLTWDQYDAALACAGKLAELHAAGKVRSAMLQNILELHARSQTGDGRWHSLLFYQVERNLSESREAQDFIRRAFLAPGNLWPCADFMVRYTMLMSGGSGEERD